MSAPNGTSPMTLDQMVGRNGVNPLPIPAQDVARALNQAKMESAEEASSYFLHAMLLAIENLAGGNKLFAGRAFDDALTHFLADLKAEFGDGFASDAAALLVHNIALFLDPARRDRVLAVIDEAKA